MRKIFLFLLCSLSIVLVSCDSDLPDKNLYDTPVFQINNNIVLNNYQIIKFDNYSNLNLFELSVSDNSILEVKDDMVYGIGLGTAILYATHKDDPNCIGSVNISVRGDNPEVYASLTKIDLNNGISYLNIANLDKMLESSLDDFNWFVKDPSICEINHNYQIIPKSIGSTTIVATSKLNELVTQSLEISVIDQTNTVVIVSDEYAGSVNAGEYIKINLSGNFQNEQFTWSTNNSEVVRFIENNQIVTLKEGVASIIIFENGNPSNNCVFTITVKGQPNINYVDRLLQTALNELYYQEGPNNDTKYGIWYKMNYEPWCAMFVSWCWYQAGLSNNLLLKYCGCYTGWQWCIEQGVAQFKESYIPKSGDVVFFLSNGASHTGIVMHCDGNYIYTIEGNASNRVDIWRWNMADARITGYASINYPEYFGPSTDYSWVMGNKDDGKPWWNNVTYQHETT